MALVNSLVSQITLSPNVGEGILMKTWFRFYFSLLLILSLLKKDIDS